MSAPYYVALYGGFLVFEEYPAGTTRKTICKVYTVPNMRLATPFDTFATADATAKYAVNKLYPPDLRYFGLLMVACEDDA